MKRHKCHSPCHERIEIGKESEAKNTKRRSASTGARDAPSINGHFRKIKELEGGK